MGPLEGFRIVEIAGIGPSQFCGMLLADMGAELIRIDRLDSPDLGVPIPAKYNLMNRSRPALAVDLKQPAGVDLVLRLCESADALFEGYRPGVMERLGLGPVECMQRNGRLVYGRMTGYGQDGPLADSVGHDTNYISLSGALNSIGDADRPPPVPLNLIGDFGGGGTYLAIGILAAMLEVSKSGKGQVVDASMVDGSASLMTMFYGLLASGMWRDQRASNVLDGAAPFIKVYATRDGKYISVCAVENRFYRALLDALEITGLDPAKQYDVSTWPEQEAVFAATFRSRSRSEWTDVLEGTDACASPVLSLQEAPLHPHNQARGTYVDVAGVQQPRPAPRFSRTDSEIQAPPEEPGENGREVLAAWGICQSEIKALYESGTVGSKTAA